MKWTLKGKAKPKRGKSGKAKRKGGKKGARVLRSELPF